MLRSMLGVLTAASLLGALLALGVSGEAVAKPKNNVSGSYNCYCLMGNGSCDMIVEAGRVRCGRSGSSPCQSSCRLDTTTSGIKGAGAIAKGGASVKAGSAGVAGKAGAAGKAGVKAAP